jgi:hypothetical protein
MTVAVYNTPKITLTKEQLDECVAIMIDTSVPMARRFEMLFKLRAVGTAEAIHGIRKITRNCQRTCRRFMFIQA